MGMQLSGSLSLTGSISLTGNTEFGGNLIPKTAQGATLGTLEMPFSEIFVSSGSINIASDTPGGDNTTISNIDGNLLISAGGMRLLGSASFIALTGSFSYISGSMTQDGDYILSGTKIITGSIDVTDGVKTNGVEYSSSLFQSSSISGSVIELTKGDNTTQQFQIPNGLGFSGLGWGRYDDTTYTTGSAFSIADGVTATIPCNASSSIETHLHSTISFYTGSGQKLQAENEGDVYSVTIDFSMKAATNPADGDFVRISMNNTTGTPYTRVGRDLFFAKNDTNWHTFHELFQYYADEDFVLNGNQFNITPNGVAIEVADVIIFIQRTQNHSQH